MQASLNVFDKIDGSLLQSPKAKFLTKLDVFLKPEEVLNDDWISLANNLKHVKLLAYCSSEIVKILGKICEASNKLESIEWYGENILGEYKGNVESVLRKNGNTLTTFHLPTYKCSEVEAGLISQCLQLESLSFCCDNISAAKFNAIPDEKNLKRIELHFLNNNVDKNVAAFLRHPNLSQLTSLQISSYSENKITSDVIKSVDALKRLTDVRLDDPFVQLSTCCCRRLKGDHEKGRLRRPKIAGNFPTIFDLISGEIPIGEGGHVLCSRCYAKNVLKRL